MGFLPKAHQPTWKSTLSTLEECKKQLQNTWEQAVQVMVHAQSLWCKTLNYHPY